MQKIKQYFLDSFQELGKVTWPTRTRALNICIIVVIFVTLSAIVVAGVDFAFHEGYTQLLKLAPDAPAVEVEPVEPAVPNVNVETGTPPPAPAAN